MSRNNITKTKDKLIALPKGTLKIPLVRSSPPQNDEGTSNNPGSTWTAMSIQIVGEGYNGYDYYKMKDIKELSQRLKNVIRKSYL